MKKVIIVLIAVTATFATFAQTGKEKMPSDKTETKKTYTCSMHPEVVSNKPGKCPKCGMNLVEKKAGNDKKMGKTMDMKKG